MHDRPSGVTDWIRGLFGGTVTETPPLTGEEALTTVRRAVMTTELLMCDALCHQDTEIGPTDRTTNAFGTVVSVTSSSGARGVLAAQSGLALTGSRVAGFVATGHLSQIKDQLLEAVQRRLPLVVHATVETTATGDHSSYHDLTATGAVLLFPRNGQDVPAHVTISPLQNMFAFPTLFHCGQLSIPVNSGYRDANKTNLLRSLNKEKYNA